MNTQKTYEIIDQASSDYEDGETGIHSCIEMFIDEHNLSHDADEIVDIYYKNEARLAGIPQSVINGEKTLKECFSKEYIDSQCGIK